MMLAGPINRKRSTQKRYKKHMQSTRSTECDFCNFATVKDNVIAERELFWVVKNAFTYDVWDGHGVKDHLMIVPKRHVDSLALFTAEEASEYMGIVQEYEAAGYSVYARSAGNASKSIVHQHTHLIDIDTKRRRALLYLYKPHLMIAR